jgi:molecular chaperone HtpG
VHGKYLIRLLDKTESAEAREIGPHGTEVVLKTRASAKAVDVLATLKKWIWFPRCQIIAYIDDAPPVTIGFKSPKEAIETYLANPEFGLGQDRVEVPQKRLEEQP